MKILAVLAFLPFVAFAAGEIGGPRVVVLGTAQDGGFPQTGCEHALCAAARRDPKLARHVASLAIHVPASGHTFLVDATPDLPAQIEEVHTFRRFLEGKTDRSPFDGVLLTNGRVPADQRTLEPARAPRQHRAGGLPARRVVLPRRRDLREGLLLAASIAPGDAPSSSGPRVVVLGTVQDGGMPQTGCDCSHCSAARKNPALARHVASLAIDVPKTGHVYLVDATPDLPAQVEEIHGFRPHPEGKTDRHPVDGVLLTHAHIGHYLGLAHFGFESLNTKDIPAYVSPRMAEFLKGNGPWSQLVRLGNIVLREFKPGVRFDLEYGLSVRPIQVPHRDEFSDTMGFVIRGPKETLLYVPDTDTWRTWSRPLPEVLGEEKVDIALLDGTFYSPDELPDRDVTKIKHPLITDSMDLLEPLVKAGKLQVYFTHMNHSNPALDREGAARKAIEARGFRVLDEGEEFGL